MLKEENLMEEKSEKSKDRISDQPPKIKNKYF